MGAEAEEADGVVETVGAQDEVAVFEGDEAEEELASDVDGVERGMGCAIGGQRRVVSCLNASVWAKTS